MKDLNKILENLNIKESEELQPMMTEFHKVTQDCFKKLQLLRQELTSAYIVSQKVVIRENNQYILRSEEEVRKENKHALDIEKIQRAEEKTLKDILNLLSSNKNKSTDEELNINTHQEKFGILKRISNLVYKLINTLFPEKKKVDVNTKDSLNPIEIMQANIENIKLYQEELKDRSNKLKNIDELQVIKGQYQDRIQLNPKEHENSSMAERVTAELLKKNNKTHYR